MDVIVKRNGYIYLVSNPFNKGFETYHMMGKDYDDPMWKDEKNEIEEKIKKSKRQKKDEI